jgi:hypothetical protein
VWIALGLGFAISACDPVLRLHGTVRDRTNAPVEGASIVLTATGRGPHRDLSAADGTFHITMVGATKANLAVSKPGYKATERAVKPSDRAIDIVLEE